MIIEESWEREKNLRAPEMSNDHLQQTLDKFAVPEAEQAEIKAIIGSTRTDIVV